MSDLLQKINSYMREANLDAILITRRDSFLGEYFPPEKDRLKIITGGFTGSAGMAVISRNQNVLFVDSRYTSQAREQTSFRIYEIPTETLPSTWLMEHFAGKKIGFNPWTHSAIWLKQMEKTFKRSSTKLVPIDKTIISKWFGEQSFYQTDVFDYPLKYCGLSSAEKLERVAEVVRKNNWDAFIICSPENVSWLLNKRSKMVGEYPVVFERGYVTQEGAYYPLPEDVKMDFINKRIGIDLSKTPVAVSEELKRYAFVNDAQDPIDLLKACKNDVEIQNIKEACLSESRTICRFLAWIELNKNFIDELDCDLKLKQLRSEDPLYFSDSFQTIVASGVHAALAHYTPTQKSNVTVLSNPMLLVDTGGHYLNGTTDMTRTICITSPSLLMKRRYTQVLKGHLSLMNATISQGKPSGDLDKKAHYFLRKDNVDYQHATSHGIGMMLGVHEMPPVIHEKDRCGLASGMIFSNEPAYYDLSCKFGIRLENMLVAIKKKDGKLHFENLLFIPFDYRLIDFNLLTKNEKKVLKIYHGQIEKRIFPLLSLEEQHVLQPFIKAFS